MYTTLLYLLLSLWSCQAQTTTTCPAAIDTSTYVAPCTTNPPIQIPCGTTATLSQYQSGRAFTPEEAIGLATVDILGVWGGLPASCAPTGQSFSPNATITRVDVAISIDSTRVAGCAIAELPLAVTTALKASTGEPIATCSLDQCLDSSGNPPSDPNDDLAQACRPILDRASLSFTSENLVWGQGIDQAANIAVQGMYYYFVHQRNKAFANADDSDWTPDDDDETGGVFCFNAQANAQCDDFDPNSFAAPSDGHNWQAGCCSDSESNNFCNTRTSGTICQFNDCGNDRSGAFSSPPWVIPQPVPSGGFTAGQLIDVHAHGYHGWDDGSCDTDVSACDDSTSPRRHINPGNLGTPLDFYEWYLQGSTDAFDCGATTPVTSCSADPNQNGDVRVGYATADQAPCRRCDDDDDGNPQPCSVCGPPCDAQDRTCHELVGRSTNKILPYTMRCAVPPPTSGTTSNPTGAGSYMADSGLYQEIGYRTFAIGTGGTLPSPEPAGFFVGLPTDHYAQDSRNFALDCLFNSATTGCDQYGSLVQQRMFMHGAAPAVNQMAIHSTALQAPRFNVSATLDSIRFDSGDRQEVFVEYAFDKFEATLSRPMTVVRNAQPQMAPNVNDSLAVVRVAATPGNTIVPSGIGGTIFTLQSIDTTESTAPSNYPWSQPAYDSNFPYLSNSDDTGCFGCTYLHQTGETSRSLWWYMDAQATQEQYYGADGTSSCSSSGAGGYFVNTGMFEYPDGECDTDDDDDDVNTNSGSGGNCRNPGEGTTLTSDMCKAVTTLQTDTALCRPGNTLDGSSLTFSPCYVAASLQQYYEDMQQWRIDVSQGLATMPNKPSFSSYAARLFTAPTFEPDYFPNQWLGGNSPTQGVMYTQFVDAASASDDSSDGTGGTIVTSMISLYFDESLITIGAGIDSTFDATVLERKLNAAGGAQFQTNLCALTNFTDQTTCSSNNCGLVSYEIDLTSLDGPVVLQNDYSDCIEKGIVPVGDFLTLCGCTVQAVPVAGYFSSVVPFTQDPYVFDPSTACNGTASSGDTASICFYVTYNNTGRLPFDPVITTCTLAIDQVIGQTKIQVDGTLQLPSCQQSSFGDHPNAPRPSNQPFPSPSARPVSSAAPSVQASPGPNLGSNNNTDACPYCIAHPVQWYDCQIKNASAESTTELLFNSCTVTLLIVITLIIIAIIVVLALLRYRRSHGSGGSR